MTYQINLPRPASNLVYGLASLALIALMLLLAPVAGLTQDTTSSMRGQVNQPNGSPAAGASVRVTDTRTGNSRTATTSDSGQFSMSGLRVGGPYTVQIEASGLAAQAITDVYVDLGDTYTFSVALSQEQIEEITVTASALQSVQVALGPSATFSLADLQDAPAINRNINDVIAIDPRIYIDEGFNDAVQCGGASARFNSLTVDGVRLNDNFGLNSNGYPTERMPFPYDAIEQVAVELAPFDVNYGGFTACNINAVTKSGSNEFSGSVFYDYTDDSMTGDSLEGDPIDLGSFDEKRYGLTFGGPIIRDRLFFFAAYEKLEGINLFGRGAADASVATPVLGVSQAQVDRIRQISQNVYGFDPGGFVPSLPIEDEKYIIKLDWNINDDHRAAYTYTFNDGFNNNESDDGDDELEFDSHYYVRGAELNSHVGQLFSSWNDNFTTEMRVSYSELDNRQIPLGNSDVGEIQIQTWNDPGIGPQQATVYLGTDDSRQSNKLYYENTSFRLAGTYQMGDHVIKGGWEREEFDIFNLFIQHSQTEIRFDGSDQCGPTNFDGCIDAFETGNPDDVFYGNAAPSNDPVDGAAAFGYAINTLYLQDEFPIADGAVTIVAGVRYDWYTSSDVPNNNPNFLARNGFSNQSTFDGEGLIQPRLGFNWDWSDNLSIRGGVGLYSGGNPNVWLSNNYSNDGITVVQTGLSDLQQSPDSLLTLPHDGSGRPLFDIPQVLVDNVTTGSANSGVNALDPNFSIPKEWKFAIGATWDFDAGFFGSDYRVMLDYLHTEKEDSAIIFDATLEQIGTAPDGRPIYRNINRADPDCAINPTTCSQRLFNQDFILTNASGSDGSSDVWSVSLSKAYEWGMDWTFGYAYTESTDVSPMTSSVAFSNYVNISVDDPNDPTVASSNYNIPNRFTFRANFRRAFFGDYLTKFTLFGRVNEGRPYSVTFNGGGSIFGDTLNGRHLLYIPTGANDPNVQYGAGFDQAAFFAFLNDTGLNKYAGGIAPRNSLNSGWWQKFDVRIEQELPGFQPEHRFSAFFLIENVGNLINDDWGVLKEVGFPRNQQVVAFALDTVNNQYIYNTFLPPAPQGRVADASLWELRFGVKYEF